LRTSFVRPALTSLEVGAILSYRYPLLQSLCLLYPARPTVQSRSRGLQVVCSATPECGWQTAERLSWGFVPFSVSSARSPLNPGLPHPARSALRVSHPLSGFLLPAPPRLFSSWNAPGIRPSELSPPVEPYASRRPYPPAVLSCAFIHGWRRRLCQIPGSAESLEAASGCCSLPELVHFYKGFSFVEGRCSPGLLLFRGFPLLVVPLSFESGSSLNVPPTPPPTPQPRGTTRPPLNNPTQM
jgi:hypothetical protein